MKKYPCFFKTRIYLLNSKSSHVSTVTQQNTYSGDLGILLLKYNHKIKYIFHLYIYIYILKALQLEHLQFKAIYKVSSIQNYLWFFYALYNNSPWIIGISFKFVEFRLLVANKKRLILFELFKFWLITSMWNLVVMSISRLLVFQLVLIVPYLWLYSYESDFVSFNLTFRVIYPKELEIKDSTDTPKWANYLDLHLELDEDG